MAKYTYDDINIAGNNERVSNAFGKECYYGYSAKEVLDNALNDRCKFILRRVDMDNPKPFGDTGDRWYPFMIIKKEDPKPEYTPFKNQEEFLNHYVYHKDRLVESSSTHQLSSLGGVWLKDKYLTAFYMVIEIWSDGVVIGDIKMKTAKRGNGEYFTMNDVTKWCELLEDYTFLDGSPCGIPEGAAICDIEDSKAKTFATSSKSV